MKSKILTERIKSKEMTEMVKMTTSLRLRRRKRARLLKRSLMNGKWMTLL